MTADFERIKATPPYRAARAAKVRLERFIFERGDVADTDGKIGLDELGLAHPERIGYEPSAWSFLRRALRRCEVRESDVFLDLGSGKGRVIWQAAQHPFARVIGVEISPELNAVARRNIERNRDRLAAGKIELITGDAASFEVPDDVTFAYIFSSFQGETFRRVIANITESLDRNPRELILIYANPVMDEAVRETGWFDLVHVLKGIRPDVSKSSWVHIYSTHSQRPTGV